MGASLGKVLAQVHPEMGFAPDGLAVAGAFLSGVIRCIVAEIEADGGGLGEGVQAAVQKVLPGALARHAMAEGAKATSHAAASGSSGRQFSPKEVTRHAAVLRPGLALLEGAETYLAAVVEYMAAEVSELSGQKAKDRAIAHVKEGESVFNAAIGAEDVAAVRPPFSPAARTPRRVFMAPRHFKLCAWLLIDRNSAGSCFGRRARPTLAAHCTPRPKPYTSQSLFLRGT